MSQIPLYPLRFEPILQYRPWGGRRLGKWLGVPLPGDGPIGEAWLLSDREDHPSVVADGPLKGQTIAQLMAEFPVQMLGNLAATFHRFPLLLKFLDAREALSVQVHPSDQQPGYLPAGETGKTEAWVVLETGAESRIYAGLKPATTPDDLSGSIEIRTLPDLLASFMPKPGDAVLLEAGTVHALADTVVFEAQENSDVTFRLYDWDRVDAATGRRRSLQVDQAMACIDFTKGPLGPLVPVVEALRPALRERLLFCEHFGLWRISGDSRFVVGKAGTPRVILCIAGEGQIDHNRVSYELTRRDVFLIPAVVGTCVCQPRGTITLLEISLPEGGITR